MQQSLWISSIIQILCDNSHQDTGQRPDVKIEIEFENHVHTFARTERPSVRVIILVTSLTPERLSLLVRCDIWEADIGEYFESASAGA